MQALEQKDQSTTLHGTVEYSTASLRSPYSTGRPGNTTSCRASPKCQLSPHCDRLPACLSLVAVVGGLVGSLHRHIDVLSLRGGELGDDGIQLAQVEERHLLVEVLGEHIHLLLVLAGILLLPELELSNNLFRSKQRKKRKTGEPDAISLCTPLHPCASHRAQVESNTLLRSKQRQEELHAISICTHLHCSATEQPASEQPVSPTAHPY